MERIGFLQMLGFGLAPVAIATKAITPEHPIYGSTLDDLSYKEWSIKWNGWIRPANMHVLSGYWVAYRKDSHLGAYSAVPGACGWFYPLQLFDTSIHEDDGQVVITPETSIKVAEKQKQMGLTRLIEFLHEEKYSQFYHL